MVKATCSEATIHLHTGLQHHWQLLLIVCMSLLLVLMKACVGLLSDSASGETGWFPRIQFTHPDLKPKLPLCHHIWYAAGFNIMCHISSGYNHLQYCRKIKTQILIDSNTHDITAPCLTGVRVQQRVHLRCLSSKLCGVQWKGAQQKQLKNC